MLLLGTGDKALDKLRLDKNNNNHGLDFSTNVNASSCQKGLSILTNSFTAVRKNGFFLQWYATLPTESPVYGLVTRTDGQSALTNRRRVGSEAHLSPQEIVGYKASIFDLLKYIPDLDSSLQKYGVNVPSSRAEYEVTLADNADSIRNLKWSIHGTSSSENLQSILDQFVVPSELQDKLVKRISHNDTSCVVTITVNEGTKLTYPSYRETINNEKIMYGIRHLDKHEIVDAYLSAYGLSMLSRYFPDIWVSCLESQCKAAKLIERLLFILIQKAPVMALATMRSDDFVISTHRPPWH